MARYRVFFLVVLAIAVGCAEHQDVPVQVYIDRDFSELERQAVTDAVNQWSDWAGRRYAHGDAVFEIVGLHGDTFNVHDYEDGRHSIYRISEPVPDEQYLQDVYADSGGVGGNSSLSDCIIVAYEIDEYLEDLEEFNLDAIEEGEIEWFDVAEYIDQQRYGRFHNLTLHELGHMLGLTHFNQRVGVMNSAGPNIYNGIEYLTDADLDAFCLVYDCNNSCIQDYD